MTNERRKDDGWYPTRLRLTWRGWMGVGIVFLCAGILDPYYFVNGH